METRTIVVTEVNPETSQIAGLDEYDQRVLVSVHYNHPVFVMPHLNEHWVVYKEGIHWFLDRRADDDTTQTTIPQLKAGDIRLESKNDLHINASHILINGESFDPIPKINILANDEQITEHKNINLVSSKNITFYPAYNEEKDQIDIQATITFDPEMFPPIDFENGWLDFGGDSQVARYYFDLTGLVHIEGVIKHASNSQTGAIFTLPFEYVPEYNHTFICSAGPGACKIDVHGFISTTPGRVNLTSYMASGTAASISLQIIYHPAASVIKDRTLNTEDDREIRITGA